MPAYAIANLSNVDVNAEIARYIATIDETLAPFERPLPGPRQEAPR